MLLCDSLFLLLCNSTYFTFSGFPESIIDHFLIIDRDWAFHFLINCCRDSFFDESLLWEWEVEGGGRPHRWARFLPSSFPLLVGG